MDQILAKYELNYSVMYETDDEYRLELARVFRQCPLTVPYGPAPFCNNEPLPYPQRCDVKIDFDAIDPIICSIVEHTKSDACMHKLYEKAAARILSTDIDRGAILLFSHTAFFLFHRCIHAFFYHPDQWNEQNENYKELMRRMSKKKERAVH